MGFSAWRRFIETWGWRTESKPQWSSLGWTGWPGSAPPAPDVKGRSWRSPPPPPPRSLPARAVDGPPLARRGSTPPLPDRGPTPLRPLFRTLLLPEPPLPPAVEAEVGRPRWQGPGRRLRRRVESAAGPGSTPLRGRGPSGLRPGPSVVSVGGLLVIRGPPPGRVTDPGRTPGPKSPEGLHAYTLSPAAPDPPPALSLSPTTSPTPEAPVARTFPR